MNIPVLFTSEAVTEAHPDRICDTISDALVDAYLRQDPLAKITAECALSKHVVFIAARFAALATVDIPEITRGVMQALNYRDRDFSASDCTVVTSLITRPLDDRSAGDEGDFNERELDALVVSNHATLFGFACTHTPERMPLPVTLASRLARRLTAARNAGHLPHVSPDATIQVGIELVDRVPRQIRSITVIAGQENPHDYSDVELQHLIRREVIEPVCAEHSVGLDPTTEIFINPQETRFIKSGPSAHSGMTGRKSAADGYGGYARQSSSAFSGKGPTRIDRVGAYAARYAAKNLVAAGLARECEVQLSYTIGKSRPVSIAVETFGTGTVTDDQLGKRLAEVFDFRLGAIIRDFNLRRLPSEHPSGFFRLLPAHGHFGNSKQELPWERTDKAAHLK